ncbi:MAG TPA: hypothetical protein VFE43_04550, partial [Candidatus Binataceae bacterium]|nr:hypothetical protein [Candidatus Binataceae bacterium]
MKELPPETPAELRQQAVKNRDWLRVSNFKFIVACCLAILSLLTIVLHTGFNPMLRPLVILLSIVGVVSLVLRSQTTGNSPRPYNQSDQTRDALPESAKKVYDMKDLPPELAANPGVQKLFEWAGAEGGWLKIAPSDQITGQESQNPETVKIGAGFGEPGHLQVGKVEDLAQLPLELASSSNVQKLSALAELHEFLPTDLLGIEKVGTPLSSKLISILSRIVKWASLIVIFAA